MERPEPGPLHERSITDLENLHFHADAFLSKVRPPVDQVLANLRDEARENELLRRWDQMGPLLWAVYEPTIVGKDAWDRRTRVLGAQIKRTFEHLDHLQDHLDPGRVATLDGVLGPDAEVDGPGLREVLRRIVCPLADPGEFQPLPDWLPCILGACSLVDDLKRQVLEQLGRLRAANDTGSGSASMRRPGLSTWTAVSSSSPNREH